MNLPKNSMLVNNPKLSILVIGAGAVGGITAALLRLAGHDVEIAVRNEELASLISEKGIEINGVCGNHIVQIPAYSQAADINGRKDVLLLATKATDMIDAARIFMPVLKENGYLVSLQNGICEEDLIRELGKDKVIGCVTGWGATMEHHGKVSMTSGGDFILGYPEKEPDDFLQLVADVMLSVVPVRVTGNITGHKYSKLIINSCITSLGAICGMYLGSMLSKKKIRRIFIEIIREAVAVSDKMQIKIEIFSGKLDFRDFVMKNDILADIRRHLLIMAIGVKYRRLKSSGLQSLERGQRTEVDYLNGYIVKHGISMGVDVPVNSIIVKMVHEIEAGEREITFNNFNDPFFDSFN
jgi:2-dehydropantoate 2-reductase